MDRFVLLRSVVRTQNIFTGRTYIVLLGCPQALVDELENYQPGNSAKMKNFFQNANTLFVKRMALSVIYNGLRAADAGGEIHSNGLEAIHTLAKKLGVNEEQVQEVRSLCEEKNEQRYKRPRTLFLKNLDNSLNEFYKHYSQKSSLHANYVLYKPSCNEH